MHDIINPIPLRFERSRFNIHEVFPHYEEKHLMNINNLLKVVDEAIEGLKRHSSPGPFLKEVAQVIKEMIKPHEEEYGVRLTTFTIQQIGLDYLYYLKGGGESNVFPLSLSLRSRLNNGYYNSVYENVPNLAMQNIGTLRVTYSGDFRDLLAPSAVTIIPTEDGLRTFIEVADIEYPRTKEHVHVEFSDHSVVTINGKAITLPDELIDTWFLIEELEAGRKKTNQPKVLIEAKQRSRRLSIQTSERLAKSISKKYNSASIGRLPFEKKDIHHDFNHSFLVSQRRFQERFYQSLGFHTLLHRVKTEYVTEL